MYKNIKYFAVFALLVSIVSLLVQISGYSKTIVCGVLNEDKESIINCMHDE